MNPAGQPASRRQSLREGTSADHAAVDAAVGQFTTIDDYRRYLRAMYRFRRPIELALAESKWPDPLAGWRPQPLAELLRSDMDDLRISLPDPPPPRPLATDLSSLLGTLYVLEGSTLGARLLYRRALLLGLSERHGARHLAEQSASTDNWRSLLRVLESDIPIDDDQLIRAARGTFQAAAAALGAKP